jgi:hypothetical protein
MRVASKRQIVKIFFIFKENEIKAAPFDLKDIEFFYYFSHDFLT